VAWLSSWVKEILVVVLIATFADMLLPNKSMQRYVKTVIGLFLLMLLLSPVLRLFRMDWDTDKLLRSIDQQSRIVTQPALAQPPSASLTAVRQEAERLKALGDASAKQLVEAKLAESIRLEVASRFGENPPEVQVATALDAQGTLSVTSVRVVLAPAGRSLAAESQMEPVQPIAPIRPFAPVGSDEAAPASASVSSDAREQGEAASEANPIADYIATTWQVSPSAIEIRRSNADRSTNRR
jgi:stage III sporulation protein AF